MDFTLSKKHEMARTLFKEFAENEVKPLAQDTDENEQFPAETVEKMAKAGFMGIPVPKEYGGQGCDILTYAMCVKRWQRYAELPALSSLLIHLYVSIRSLHTEQKNRTEIYPRPCFCKKLGASSDRARSRNRCSGTADKGCIRRRRMGTERIQVLHHQW